MQTVTLPYCTLSYDGRIVILTINEGATFDVAETREMIKTSTLLTNNQPYVLLSDARVYFSITPEARKVTADINEAPLLKANAVIINNLPSRLLANFFANFNKPHFKFRVFTNEEKAINWLLAAKAKLETGKKKRNLVF